MRTQAQEANISVGGGIKRRTMANTAIRGLTEADFSSILRIEKIVFGNDPDFIDGADTPRVIREQNGFKYSYVYTAEKVELRRKGGVVGYLVAVEPEPRSIYLHDLAVIPSLQGHGIGWELFQIFAISLLAHAHASGERIFLEMHLRSETSVPFMEKHALALATQGITLVERENLFGHYGPGKDAEYHRYEVAFQYVSVAEKR